jgi:magnesium transporter
MKFSRLIKKQSHKIGLPPGTMLHIGEKKAARVRIDLIDYNQSEHDVREIKKIEETFPYRDSQNISWLDITGLHETDTLNKICDYFHIHPLVQEDIINTAQRPKFEVYPDYVFVVMKMLQYDEAKHEIDVEQISLILGKNYVMTFQEREGDVFEPVRQRIKNIQSRFRTQGSDYLFYALMDIIVDNYFLLLENLGEQIEDLEGNVLENPDSKTVERIQGIRRELILMRRSIWPLREVISAITREDTPFITQYTAPYLRDLYDHAIQVIDTIETFREMIGSVLDVYLSNMSNKMNEIMKVLTIIATIFIPLTFIAGIYGMNFEFMPELHWKWGYLGFWIIIFSLFIGLLIYFRRRNWL